MYETIIIKLRIELNRNWNIKTGINKDFDLEKFIHSSRKYKNISMKEIIIALIHDLDFCLTSALANRGGYYHPKFYFDAVKYLEKYFNNKPELLAHCKKCDRPCIALELYLAFNEENEDINIDEYKE